MLNLKTLSNEDLFDLYDEIEGYYGEGTMPDDISEERKEYIKNDNGFGSQVREKILLRMSKHENS